MIINNISIKGFGKISNLEIKPKEGFNIIYGDNEAGKSTIQWFIKGVFYGLKGGREKDGMLPPLKYFLPWGNPNYGGLIEYSIKDGQLYTVIRDFVDNSVKILDSSYNDITDTFDISKDKLNKFAEEHLGLSEACFEKSVFIKQLDVKVDGHSKEDLLSKIVNIAETGFDDISFKRAEKALKDALITYVGTEKTSARPLDIVNNRLKDLKDEFEEVETKRLMLLDVEENLKIANSKVKEFKAQKNLLDLFKELVDIIKIIYENEKVRKELKDINNEIYKSYSNKTEKTKELSDKINSLNGEYEKYDKDLKDKYIEFNKKQKHQKTINYLLIIAVFITTLSACVLAITVASDVLIFRLPFFKKISILIGTIGLASSLGLLKEKISSTKKIKNLCNKISSFEEHKGSILSKIKSYKNELNIFNGSLNNAIEYLIKRVSNITGSNIVDSNNYNFNNDYNCIITEEIDKIHYQTSELIKEAQIIIEKLKKEIAKWGNTQYFEQNKGWAKILSSINIIEEDCINNGQEISELEIEIIKLNDEINQNIYNISLDVKEYETIISAYAFDNDQLQRIAEEIKELELKKEKLIDLKFSLSKALEVLTLASDELKKDYMPLINRSMSEYINKLTDNKYFDLRSNEKLELMILDSGESKIVPISQLSKGTIDQAYLALRLALIDIFSQGGEKLPLIMDEVFAQYDDTRVEVALNMLKEISKERQILLFSCKRREVEIASKVFKEELNLITI